MLNRNNIHKFIIIKRIEFEHPSDKLEIDKLNNRLKLTWCQRDELLSKN